ncbi:AraC family transcriptional regulator with amidase-like domain [Nocardia tenerifensis]|uniref:AraC family transcriptional regulator with amidase-like domain n=1 Tax=Nocardia tenerifensis TaxID=228006 RepID=A0A318JSV6_9NOCA|nr:helix-turn-helix domain-containing protein [Nocardia tenerifensis]PXX55645.1 AraC family transcriptional regulator with amidase-like domain [Nocardia tenerifensis]
MPATRTIVFVVFQGMQISELAGPMDVFALLNEVAERPSSQLPPELWWHVITAGADAAIANGSVTTPPYRLLTASPGGRSIRADGGLTLSVEHSLTDIAAGEDFDTLVVVGGDVAGPGAAEVVPELADLARKARRVASVCGGALLLAAAGLLDGYRATTHWTTTGILAQRFPRVTVEPDRIYVRDRDRWTSAGMSAGVDLALALVEDDHGRETAAMIARLCVVFTRRPGGQAQFSAQLRAQPARTPAIRAVQQWLPDHLGEDLTVAALARRTGMSERSFARAFRSETGSTPATFIEDLRIEAARRLLESTELTVGAIARQIGYRHGETLHRVFARRVGTTPERYRQHFGSSAA